LIAIVDTGPLLASFDNDDREHNRCEAFFRAGGFDLVIPALVVAEVCYFLSTRGGPSVEATFLRRLPLFEVETPAREEWPTIADLVERYADFPLGATDASVAVLAERLGTDLIVSLDHRHFGALRMSDGRPFRLLPD
jgi:predicted nucleic acid-binding protein